MLSPPIIENEAARLASLRSFGILDTPAEAAFDELVELAAWTCHAPIAALTLIDRDRQWFKSSIGLDVTETDREIAFCAHSIAHDQTVVVPDAKLDPRFAENPFVTGDPEIRFYAGVPIIVDDGAALGTLCVLDTRPRSLFADERRALEILARQARDRLEGVRLERTAVDALTGTAASSAATRWLLAQPTDRSRAAVHVDIDGLAAINKDHGDAAGDRTLVATARRLEEAAPGDALVARTGDDEFAVLIHAIDDDELDRRVEALRHELITDDEFQAAVSMGLAIAAPGDDGQDLLLAATRATAQEKDLRRSV